MDKKTVDEQLICFDVNLISEYRGKSLTFYDNAVWHKILDNLVTIPRSEAETNYDYKQLVVYIVVKCGDKYLTYQRTLKTTEERLRLEYSIGIGGHVNLGDQAQMSIFDKENPLEFIHTAVMRELKEEIELQAELVDKPELICFVNDDSVDVGKVHFGTVWLVELAEPKVALRGEAGIGKLAFNGLEYFEENEDKFETWSQLVIENLKYRDEMG